MSALAMLVLIPCVALIAGRAFDGLYGQDAYAYLAYATGPLRDAIQHLAPLPEFPFGPGYPAIVSALSLVTGTEPTTGLIVSLVAGASVPVITALIAWELLSDELDARPAITLLAGGVAALTGQLWQSSVVVMSDTTALALATAAAWGLARYGRTDRSRWLVLASVTMAGAIATRWIYGLVAIPLAVGGAVVILRRHRITAAGLGHLALAALPGLVVLLPVLTPMIGAIAAGTTPPFAVDFAVHSWDPLNALRSTFTTADGTLSYPSSAGQYYLLLPAQPYFFTPLLAPVALVGLVRAVARPRALTVSILVAWPVVVLLFLVGDQYQNPRFGLAIVPPVAILIGLGARHLVLAAARRGLRAGRPATITYVGAGLAAMLVGGVLLTTRFIDRQEADKAAYGRLAAQVPTGARLISFGPTLALRRRLGPGVLELFELTPDRALAVTADGQPTYVLTDPQAIAGQWAGRVPDLTLQALRRARGLDPVASAGSYTLFRTRSAGGAASPMMSSR